MPMSRFIPVPDWVTRSLIFFPRSRPRCHASRAARVIDALGIVVDRTTWRNYAGRNFGDIPTADVFGIRLPFSLLSLSTLAAGSRRGRITGAEALAACGFPSAHRARPDRPPAAEKGRKRDEEEDEEERQAQVPEEYR